MGGQQRLQLGRGDWPAAHLDELLEPVDDHHIAVAVDQAEVAGVQPAARAEHGRGGLGLVAVAPHHLGAADQQLARLAGAEVAARLRLGHPQLGAGHDPADRARDAAGRPVGQAGPDAGLGKPVGLADGRPGQPGRQGLLGGGGQGRPAAHHQLE